MKFLCLLSVVIGMLVPITYASTPQVVIIKLDDLRGTNYESFQRIVDLTKTDDIKVAFGAIGNSFVSATTDCYDTVKGWNKNDGVEIWHHGYTHSKNATNGTFEYAGVDYNTQFNSFKQTVDILKQKCDVDIHSFGSPYNQTDAVTGQVLDAYPAVKVLMCSTGGAGSRLNLITRANLESETGVVNTYDNFVKSFDSKASSPYVVLQGHPSYWTDADITVFRQIIAYMKTKNVLFMTPYEYYQSLNPDEEPPIPPEPDIPSGSDVLFTDGFETGYTSGNTVTTANGWMQVVTRNVLNNIPKAGSEADYGNILVTKENTNSVLEFDINLVGSTANSSEPRLTKQIPLSGGKYIFKFKTKMNFVSGNPYMTIGMDYSKGSTVDPNKQMPLIKMYNGYVTNSGGRYDYATSQWTDFMLLVDTDTWTTRTYINNELKLEAPINGLKVADADTLTLYLRFAMQKLAKGQLYFDDLEVKRGISGITDVSTQIFDSEYTPLEKVVNGSMFVEKKITNNDNLEKNIKLYVATYSQDKKLIDIIVKSDVIQKYQSNKLLVCNVLANATNTFLKVFVWNDNNISFFKKVEFSK